MSTITMQELLTQDFFINLSNQEKLDYISETLPVLEEHDIAKRAVRNSELRKTGIKFSLTMKGQKLPIILSGKFELVDGRTRYEIYQELKAAGEVVNPIFSITNDPEGTRTEIEFQRKNYDNNQQAFYIVDAYGDELEEMKIKQIHKDPSVPEDFPNGRKEETACALYGSNASLIKQAFTIKKYDRDHDTDYSKFGLDGNARASQLLKLITDGQNSHFIKHMVDWLSKTEPTYLNAKEHVITKGKSKKTLNVFSRYEEMYDRITKRKLSKKDQSMVDNAKRAMGSDDEDDIDVSESMPTEHERYNDVKPHITWTSKPNNNVKVVVIGKPTINVARAIAIQLQDNDIRDDAYSVMMVDEDILNYIHDMTDKAKYLNIPSIKSDITGIVDQSNTIPYKLRELKVGSIPDELCDETFFDSQFENGSEYQDVG